MSAPSVSGRVRRTAVNIPVVSQLPSEGITARHTSVPVSILPKLPSKDVTSVDVQMNSVTSDLSTEDSLGLSSTDSSDADVEMEDVDKTPRKKPAKRTREPTPDSDTPSTASRASKFTRRSTSHSSASQSEAIPPSVSCIPSCSSSPIDPQGSSQTTGGLNRGRALGNNFNLADKDDMETDFTFAAQSVRGKFLFYTDRTKGAFPQMTIKQDVGNQLGPILTSLGRKYSPVRNTQGRIYVLEDEMWSLRGKFDEALRDPDPVEWNAAADGSLTLSIMSDLGLDQVKQLQHITGFSSSSSAGSGSMLQSASSAPAKWDDALGPLQIEIATILGISPASTKRTKGNLQQSYAKYLLIIKLMADVKQRVAAGIWPLEGSPDLGEMVEVFVSKSTWYTHHVKLFPKCESNPLLLKWLKCEADASETKEVWGGKTPSFKSLEALLALSDTGTNNTASGSSERKTKDKGKGKEKDKKSHRKNS